MTLTINMDPEKALPKLYDAINGIVQMVMEAKGNVDNPETKAARQKIVDNAMRLLGAPVQEQQDAGAKKKLTTREFALAVLDFAKPLMKLDPQRTVDALHQLYTLDEGESDSIMKAMNALVQTAMQPDVLDFTASLGKLNAIDFGL